MDEGDTVLESEEVLLTTASSISIDTLPTLVKEYGGVCFPAHIDRESYSVLSSLGDFPPELEVTTFELTPVASEEDYRKNYPALEGKRPFRSSDAHYLENMREKEFYIELEENTPSALIEYIKRSCNYA